MAVSGRPETATKRQVERTIGFSPGLSAMVAARVRWTQHSRTAHRVSRDGEEQTAARAPGLAPVTERVKMPRGYASARAPGAEQIAARVPPAPDMGPATLLATARARAKTVSRAAPAQMPANRSRCVSIQRSAAPVAAVAQTAIIVAGIALVAIQTRGKISASNAAATRAADEMTKHGL